MCSRARRTEEDTFATAKTPPTSSTARVEPPTLFFLRPLMLTLPPRRQYLRQGHGPIAEAQWLIPLLERARVTIDPREVGGDKAYQAHYNFEYARLQGIDAQIKLKKNAKPGHYNRSRGYKQAVEAARLDREGYAAKANRRNNAESDNHAFKALLGDRLYSRNETTQLNETICMAIAYNPTDSST